MTSEVKVYTYPNGEIQRVQIVRLEDWAQLEFLYLDYNDAALDCFYDIYQNYHVPACPWIFDNMVMFHIPEDLQVDVLYETKKYGTVSDKLTAVSIALQEGVKIKGGNPVFADANVEKLWRALEERNCIRIAKGKLPTTTVIPISHYPGFLTENETDAIMKVNANFFIMDKFDCATVFDHIGIPLGLCIKNGVIENPPLFHREALLVKKDGSVSVTQPDVRDLEIVIDGKSYFHGKNATIYSRPERAKTPKDKRLKLVIVGNRVVAVKESGSVVIPASGFVLCAEEMCACKVRAGERVIYRGLEDVAFGIQVGNSIIKDGIKTEHFISRFYNIYHLEPIPFPPSLYPMNFDKARAARIALGADKAGKPVLFWAEGAGKLAYTAGVDSTGASLKEMAEIAVDLGLHQAINLDGGGSAQILMNNRRSLKISDRNKSDNSEAERLVPLGLVIR